MLGEHAVVYGRPALVAGVPRRLTVTLRSGDGPRVDSDRVRDDDRPVQLLVAVARHFGVAPEEIIATVESELPAGAGFGSSAALVIAMVRAMATWARQTVTPSALLRLGREFEAMFHGRSSGVDPAAAALGGCFWYALEAAGKVEPVAGTDGGAEPPFVGPVALGAPVELIVARRPGARRTGTAVGGVRDRWLVDPPRYDRLFDAVGSIVGHGVQALRAGDVAALGATFDANHAILCDLGVSSAEIDALVSEARRAGALGAKLTGGGAGGSILALVRDPGPVCAALQAVGATTESVRLGGPTT